MDRAEASRIGFALVLLRRTGPSPIAYSLRHGVE